MTTTTLSTAQDTTTWTIDPAHTQAEFEVKHMMFARVRGRLGVLSGTLHLAPEAEIGQSRVDVVLESASIDTGQKDRDVHLRSPDFFDVERFPELRFSSQSVVRTADGSLLVSGDLTIKDVTRPVTLSVTENGQGVDPWGQSRVGFSATTSIDRRDFGLSYNQALETGGILVGTEVRITLEVQAIQASA